MAQDGDTITYTYNGGVGANETRQSEDISNITSITVEYIDGSGGKSDETSGGSGGRVENVVVDVTGYDTLYIWVGGTRWGRYGPGTSFSSGNGGPSSEISFESTDQYDTDDAPVIAGVGGGGGSWGVDYSEAERSGNGGSRGGSGNDFAEGSPPPLGGDGGPIDGYPTDGEGFVDDRPIITDSGNTIKGGGSGSDTEGEIKISYTSLSSPDPPSNLTAGVQ